MQPLGEIYDRHASCLYAIALRITGDRDAAADALESAFVSLSKHGDVGDPVAYLIHATRDSALARQTRPASATVVVPEPSPRSMVEAAWYDGMTVSDLATRYGISEAKARGMLCDGMAELRMKFAAGTK
jgi:DNA-directed RNA polymerase specialized sigma24 family protein